MTEFISWRDVFPNTLDAFIINDNLNITLLFLFVNGIADETFGMLNTNFVPIWCESNTLLVCILVIRVFPKWIRTFIEFSESDKSLKHVLGSI